MTEEGVEIIIQRAKERNLEVRPRIISDNGPQFIAKDFKTFILQIGNDPCAHVTVLSPEQRQDRAVALHP